MGHDDKPREHEGASTAATIVTAAAAAAAEAAVAEAEAAAKVVKAEAEAEVENESRSLVRLDDRRDAFMREELGRAATAVAVANGQMEELLVRVETLVRLCVQLLAVYPNLA